MKKSIIAAAALALLASTGAKAADIVTYQEQPVAAPAAPAAVNWNGVYVGGTIGGSWANSKTGLRGTTGYNNGTMEYGRIARKNADPSSFIGGIYAGYNFQPTFLSNSFLKDIVFGIETDWLWNGGSGSGNKAVSLGEDSDPLYYKADVRQKWNGSTRLRAGYAIGPEGRFLPYFAAGVSYADIRAKSKVALGDTGIGFDRRSTKTRAGWNIGAGVDYVPPILNDHIVLRAEYRFTDFGAGAMNKVTGEDFFGNPVVAKQSVKYNQNDFRVGVAYKF